MNDSPVAISSLPTEAGRDLVDVFIVLASQERKRACLGKGSQQKGSNDVFQGQYNGGSSAPSAASKYEPDYYAAGMQ